MAAKASNLAKFNCDFVVATTQASINSSMLEYLAEGTQPAQHICILYDTDLNPTVQVSLEQLKQMTKVDPFDIPEGTPSSDPRIQALSNAMFYVGIKVQMGVPQGVDPRQLPPVVTLKSADQVHFTLFCSEATVVQLKTVGPRSLWKVHRQPAGPVDKLWTIQTTVDLMVADLDKELNQSTYLQGRPDLKQQLKNSLLNLSGTAFSLQQLLFDLDNAILEDDTTFEGVEDPEAQLILGAFFLKLHKQSAKEHGLPLVAVTVVSQEPDPSSLHMTGFERTVTKVDENNGEVSTLNYLCAINNNPVPSQYTHFDWNWVSPEDVNQQSGVIVINRNILAKYIAEKLKPVCAESCYLPTFNGDYTIALNGGQTPTLTLPPEGPTVIQFKYDTRVWGTAEGVALDGSKRNMTLEVSPEYDCDVSFVRNKIIVNQKLWILVWYDPGPNGGPALSPVEKGVTETYEMSVDETGALHLTRTDESTWDKSVTAEPEETDSRDGQMMEYLNLKFRDQIYDLVSNRLHEFRISQVQNFVFPGAKAFTYKDPVFSNNQDLICEITYVDPVKVSPTQDPLQSQPDADQVPGPADAGNAPPSTLSSTVGTLTASTALMQNYIQGEIVSPTGKFEALQTGDGHALLFAIDSTGVFHVFEEQSGTLHTGWQVHDLSTAAIQLQFPGETRAVVRTFEVGQSVVDGSIGLMMAVQLDGNDHLFSSLGNSNQDLSWITSSHWTMVPFDPVNEVPQKITVCGALFAETTQRTQYLVVDIDRPSQSTTDPHVTRYHIDPACKTGHYWVKHDIAIDLAASDYQSAVGRMPRKPVDGIYNAGRSGTGGAGQLVYEPIINAYGDGPVNPVRLKLPGGAIPSAIATARSNAQDGGTDLYTVGGSTLYCFAADRQEDMNEPLALCTSDFLAGTDILRAMTHEGVTTLWGRNQSYQVYYLSCLTSQVLTPAAWSAPVPILTDIEHMAAYANCADGGNTIFVAGKGRFERLIQGTAATGRAWRAHEIAIAAPPQQKSTSIRSYTTTIHVTQSDTSSPIPKATVQLSSSSRTPVYINGLYYVLSPVVPILCAADAMGSLTVVEATDSLQAAVLTASLANTTLTVNPMNKTVAKFAALDTAEKLRGAQVPTKIVAGGIMGTAGLTPLLNPSTNDEDVEAVARNLGLLKDAYTKIHDPSKTANDTEVSICRDPQPEILAITTPVFCSAMTKVTNFGIFDDFWHGIKTVWGDFKDWLSSVGDAILSSFGDIWQSFKHAGEAAGRLFRDAGTGMWHFVTRIGGKIFHAAMNTWHDFVGAMGWMIGKVVGFAKAAWTWVESLFNWPDIRRTKDVTHNLVRLWMQQQVDQIPNIANRWDKAITGLENTLNQFAGIADFSPLDDHNNVLKKPAAKGAANPNEGQNSKSQFLATKYRDHAHQLTITGDNSLATDGLEGLLNDLLTAVSQEADVLGAVFDQLQKLIQDFSSLSVENVLKRLMGVLADTVLSSVQVVVDALLRVLYTLTQSALDVLDTKIHIPVISDILNFIGVPDVSFLDLFTWIIAMAYTEVYKITHNKKAPFPADDSSVSALIAARSWGEITILFGQTSTSSLSSFSSFSSSSSAARPSTLLNLSHDLKEFFFTYGHAMAGLTGLPLGSVTVLDAEDETGSTKLGVAKFVLAVLNAGLQGATNSLSPRDPIANDTVTGFSYGILTIRLASLAYFSGVFQWAVGKFDNKWPKLKVGKLQVSNASGVGAVVDAVLVLPSIAVTAWHLGELTQKPAGKVRSAAILEECGNVVSYIQRSSYALAMNDPEPDSKELAVGLAGLTVWIAAGFQIAEAEWC